MAISIIGNRLSASKADFLPFLRARNPAPIQDLVRQQVDAGVGSLLLDLGPEQGDLTAMVRWLIQAVQAEAEVALVVRTANVEAMRLAARTARGPFTVDATAATVEDWRPFLEIARERNAVLAVSACSGARPTAVAARVRRVTEELIPAARQAGLPPQRLLVDPLVMSIRSEQAQALVAVETLRALRRVVPEPPRVLVHLEDVAVGVPGSGRRLLERTFLVMLMAVGLDAIAADPLDELVRRFLRVVQSQDASMPLGRLLVHLQQATVEGRGLRADEVEARDPEQVAIAKAVSLLRNEVVYTDAYLAN